MEPFIIGTTYNLTTSFGIKILGDHIFICGGSSGTLFHFSLSSKKLIHRFHNYLSSDATFLNHLAIEHETGDILIVDSTDPTVWKVKGVQLGNSTIDRPLEAYLDLTDKVVYEAGLNGNGMAFLPRGQYIVL
ncbi:hypothetical protein FN846DRAFT_712351 [Sphaerosporella brunnea]|uniref:Uncharacterized protein n=1 Tax=Sphaerosporella brunnea TaxID=1250544 RepID=A0A5J5EYH0_9PEZI|nr:hypothetical protein FN846DRAFT_712351 [Sphaerosporella brunnea]